MCFIAVKFQIGLRADEFYVVIGARFAIIDYHRLFKSRLVDTRLNQ